MKPKRNLTIEDIIEVKNIGSDMYPMYETQANRFNCYIKNKDVEIIKDLLRSSEEYINGTMDFVYDIPKGSQRMVESKLYKDKKRRREEYAKQNNKPSDT